jgi:predicted ATPase
MPGFFDDWVLRERQRLAETYFQAVHRLVALLEDAGNLQSALHYARQAVRLDPLREEFHAEFIGLLAAAGQPAAALRQFQELERLLARELGAAPSPETQSLVRKIREQAAGPGGRDPASGAVSPPRITLASLEPAPTSLPLPARSWPPPGTAPDTPGYLPAPLSRFFGREAEIARLQQLLQDPQTRLVTLTGPGGSGKTRLALEVARILREPFHGAIWWVPLQDLVDPLLVADQTLDAMCLPRSTQLEPLEQILTFLCRQRSLLLLDNFEQLLPEGSSILQTLLERAETLTLLVTSRQRLGMTGEREFPVSPLPTPADTPIQTASATPSSAGPQPLLLMECPSVRLFADRAQAVRPDFRVTPANAEAVAGLCRRLEGLPLALELAAARIAVLTPAQMLARLDHRFEILVSRGHAQSPRHRSLWAALDWSYQLLPPELQRFFARLSVFRGGWTLEAAETVCDESLALQRLEELTKNSLVLAEEIGYSGEAAPQRPEAQDSCVSHASEMRFRLLETLREYGAEQLTEQERTDLEQRHAQFYLCLAEAAAPKFRSAARGEWLTRTQWEHDNLRAVLTRSLTRSSGEASQTGLRLATALPEFWDHRGYWTEGRQWLGRTLAKIGEREHTPARARALFGAGFLAFGQGDYVAAEPLLEESRAISRETEDIQGLASALRQLGHLSLELLRHADAAALLEESLALFRAKGSAWEIALTLFGCGAVRESVGDQTASELFEESLRLFRSLGDTWGMSRPLFGLGRLALREGDYASARSLLEEAAALRRQAGDRSGVSMALNWLGTVARCQGDYPAAKVIYEESLAIRQDMGNKRDMAFSLNNLGIVAQLQGDYEGAATHFHQSLELFRELGDGLGVANEIHSLGEVARCRGDYVRATDLYRESLTLYRQLGTSARGGIEECLRSLAAVAAAQRQPEQSARLSGAAQALRDALGIRFSPRPQQEHDAQQLALQQTLGTTSFRAAWTSGYQMDWEVAASAGLGES